MLRQTRRRIASNLRAGESKHFKEASRRTEIDGRSSCPNCRVHGQSFAVTRSTNRSLQNSASFATVAEQIQLFSALSLPNRRLPCFSLPCFEPFRQRWLSSHCPCFCADAISKNPKFHLIDLFVAHCLTFHYDLCFCTSSLSTGIDLPSQRASSFK